MLLFIGTVTAQKVQRTEVRGLSTTVPLQKKQVVASQRALDYKLENTSQRAQNYKQAASEMVLTDSGEYCQNAILDQSNSRASSSLPTEVLSTGFAGGNGNFGNMFDLNILNDVTLTSFDVHGQATAVFDVEVYAKTGTHVGFEGNAAAWTLIGTATGITSNGLGVPTPLNLNLGYSMLAGETHAFYVTPVNPTTGNGFQYTNGTGVGNVWASDANIEFLEGAAKNYPFTGTTFAPRVFNGNIIYETAGGGGGDVWTVTVEDTANFGDEVTWELRDSGGNVILSGGPYGAPPYSDTQMVTTNGEPLEFFIESMGTFNDNTPIYTVSCGGNVIVTGQLAGGTDTTEPGLVCGGGSSGMWTVLVEDTVNFGDEVTWELRDNGGNVLLSGGPYGAPPYSDTQMVTTSDEPLEFFIESMGTFNDNTPNYTISCGGTVIVSGQLAGGTDTTETGLVCGGGGGGMMCGEMNPSNGFEVFFTDDTTSGSPNQIIANDITVPLDSNLSLESITLSVLLDTGATVSSEFTIYGDAAGLPDTANIIATETLASSSETIIFTNGAVDVRDIVFDITPVMLNGQATSTTTYWLAYHLTPSTNANTTSAIESSSASAVGNFQAATVDGGASWFINGTFESVYAISGTCTVTNNQCLGATPVACGDVITGTTADNTDTGGFNASPDEWYSFTGTVVGEIVTL
ncbi:MAG: hypothetical protein CL605_02955, partial [Altibacter sp.]|nr:hypothetical protein [Altibacter sp.]